MRLKQLSWFRFSLLLMLLVCVVSVCLRWYVPSVYFTPKPIACTVTTTRSNQQLECWFAYLSGLQNVIESLRYQPSRLQLDYHHAHALVSRCGYHVEKHINDVAGLRVFYVS